MSSTTPGTVARFVAAIGASLFFAAPVLADSPITTTLDSPGVHKVLCGSHGWQYVYSTITVPSTASVSITGFRVTQADQWKVGDKPANRPWVHVVGPNQTVFDWASDNFTQDQYALSLPFALAGGSTFRVLSNYRHVAIIGTEYGSGDLQTSVITDGNDC
jgi:hypothetical protein